MRLFYRLRWFIKQEWRSYLLGILSLVGVALFGLIPPIAIGDFANLLTENGLTATAMFEIVGLIALATVAQYVLRFGWSYFIWGTSARLEKQLRTQLFTHYLEMDAPFFQKYRTGDLLAHATNDISQLQRVAGNGVLQLFDAVISGVSVIIAMGVVVNAGLTVIAVLPLLGITLVAALLGRRIHSAFTASQDAFSRLNNKTQESLMGIKAIKALGQEQEDIADFEGLVDHSIKVTRRAEKLDAFFDPAITVFIGLSYVGTIIYGGYLVTHGHLSIGHLITFVTYLSQLVWPFMGLGFFFNNLQRGNASLDRITNMLAEKPLTLDSVDSRREPPVGNLTFSNVSFHYPDEVEDSITDVSATLTAGQTLGLVGSVGSGKTTLIRLLLREFDQYAGQIAFGGHDIREFARDVYLPAIGYVPQDNFLFSTSVLENIRFADPSISTAAVQQAAKWAALNDDINLLPDGYETQVGEQGISLSGGQRQRLAIARALIINPELLILDDALSAVDAQTEQDILRVLHEQRQGKTTIIATHRLSAVVDAAEILVFEHGRVTERGTHAELMAARGWYHRMYEAQQLEAKLDEEVASHGE
jgi:ATP-binding cassette subfamily B protein